MKSKKKAMIIWAVCIAAAIAVISAFIFIPGNKGSKKTPETTTEADTTAEIEIIEPETEPTSEETTTAEIIEDDGSGLEPKTEETTAASTTAREKAPEPAQTVKEVTPETQAQTTAAVTTQAYVAPAETTASAYSCGVSGHHCQNAAAHARVCNLENEGCPYCGSHSCPSFYATDAWGQSTYTPSKCPSYSAASDPSQYCQSCGRKLGDGRNGTCVQFVEACNCPNYGQYVNAWSCHCCG